MGLFAYPVGGCLGMPPRRAYPARCARALFTPLRSAKGAVSRFRGNDVLGYAFRNAGDAM